MPYDKIGQGAQEENKGQHGTMTLTVLREKGEDFPLELELVHGQPCPAEAHGRLQDVDVYRQPNHRSERVPHAVALVVQVLVARWFYWGEIRSGNEYDDEGGRKGVNFLSCVCSDGSL